MASRNPTNLFAVDGLVVVLSGGGTGIGLMMAKALEAAGAAKIYILGRRKEVLEEASKGSSIIIPITCDVTSKSDLQRAASFVTSQVGYIDLLINNAGIIGPDDKEVRKIAEDAASNMTISRIQDELLNKDPQDWAQTFAINSTAVAMTAASFLVLLDEGNKRKNVGKVDSPVVASSQIITVTSIAGFNRKISAGLAYSASKAAATHLGKMLSTLLAPFSIRSNIIAPGRYPSEMNAGDKEKKDIPPDEIPERRPGTDNDMAGTILYMSSTAGAYLNGTVIVTDGGRLSVHPSTY